MLVFPTALPPCKELSLAGIEVSEVLESEVFQGVLVEFDDVFFWGMEGFLAVDGDFRM